MFRFMKVMLVMLVMIALTAPAMAGQYCQKDDPGISMFSTLECPDAAILAFHKTNTNQSVCPDPANSGTDQNITCFPVVANLPRSPGVLLACSCSVGQSGKVITLSSLSPNGDGATSDFLHIDPGRQMKGSSI